MFNSVALNCAQNLTSVRDVSRTVCGSEFHSVELETAKLLWHATSFRCWVICADRTDRRTDCNAQWSFSIGGSHNKKHERNN